MNLTQQEINAIADAVAARLLSAPEQKETPWEIKMQTKADAKAWANRPVKSCKRKIKT